MTIGNCDHTIRMIAGVIAAAIVTASVTVACAEERVVERATKAQSGKDVRIGVFINVRPDCTSGPLPSIRLSAAPTNGTVTVRKANVTGTNYKKCLALQVPAFVAIYRSKNNFKGVDTLELEVKYPSGRSEIQKFRITVAPSPASEPI